MSRNSPSEFNDASLELFVAVQLEFDSGTVNLWNGTRDATIDGETYIGAGTLLSVSSIEETSEVAARGATLALSGLDPAFISTALQENYQNRTVSIKMGSIVDNVFSSYTIFKGRLDVMSISEGAETATIEITAENRLIDLERARSFRYTSEDQKALFPSDTGLDFVADLQDKQIVWGKA